MVNNKQTPANPRAKPKIKIFAIFESLHIFYDLFGFVLLRSLIELKKNEKLISDKCRPG